MSHLRPLILRLLTVAALAVAFAASGLAHKMPSAVPDAELQTFLANGGTLSDLCGGDGPAHAGGGPCDACRLVGAALVPGGPALSHGLVIRRGAGRLPRPTARVVLRVRDPATGQRAPPAA